MGYTPILSLPTPSLFGLYFIEMISVLKRAKFSGIELFLFHYVLKRLEKYQAIARDAQMRLSLHQPWSYGEGALPLNRLLDLVGYLPRDDYTIESLVREGKGELFVAYCDRHAEIAQLEQAGCPVDLAFQTACAWNGAAEERTHRMRYSEFVDHILPPKTPIVFDTFHVIEWRKNKPGGKAFAAYSENQLADELLRAWYEIGAERVVEIHWNDFIVNSTRGGGSDGRACLPGNGALAKGLRVLAQELKRDGWRGPIVPELSPFLIFPYTERKLSAVRERMENFFA